MKKILLAAAFLMPAVAGAQDFGNLEQIMNSVLSIINALIPIIIALAVLVFIWGVFRYVIAKSDEDKSQGRSLIIWGVVGLFVMVSVWGLVNILDDTFNLDDKAPDAPELPDQNNTGTNINL